MGPKKKAKAPKKTKEELEEERRLQDEEEARLRAEEEKRVEEARLKREAEAARRREENAKNRAAELERLALEHDEARQDLEARAVRLAELLRAHKEAKDWDNYLACQPRPDAQVEGDMNSFLNSWQLDTATLELGLPAVTAACESATEVMEDLAFVAANARATNADSLRAQCTRFIARLQELVVEKVDLTTAHVLQYADEYADLSPATSAPTSSSTNANASRGEVKLASASPHTGWVQLGVWVNLLAKGSSRNKRVEFSELGMNVDLPKAVITQSLALRVTRWPFDAFSSPSEGGSSDIALGGVFSLELLAVPSPPKRARGWIMREVPDAREQLKRLHYPLDGMVVSAALPIKASLTLPKDVLFAPTRATSASSVELPRIGWWDATRMRWEEEGVTDVVFQEDTNSVSFSTLRLTHLALLVRRDRNFHKRSWRLCMDTSPRGGAIAEDFHGGSADNELGDMRARLTLSTAIFPRIQFEITPQGARLVQPALPQLEALRKEAMPPGELLTRLARAGIDLCPPLEMELEGGEEGNRGADEKQAASTRLGFAPKLKMLEDRVIDEIASVVAGFEITDGNGNAEWGRTSGAAATRWPGAIGNSKQIVFSVKEMSWPYMTDDHEGSRQQAGEDEAVTSATSAANVLVLAEVDAEASGGCVKFRLDRKGGSEAQKVTTSMTPHEGNNEAAGGETKHEEDIYDTHVHLRRALDEISCPDARDRMDNSHVLFELTLQKMLRLLRLLSYSQPPPLRGHVKQGKTGEEDAAASPTTNAAQSTGGPDTKAHEGPHDAAAPASAAQEGGEASALPTEST
ncbi:hypothetical protein PHYPSEUDO_006905 [Phytophthora pseudosyringae]|uniref:IC97/Casc1 N-terminal domain-containing protein n=1 Tax=Phytophthora pseudosyringae TaxID=221518 RepID=A0A8T1VKW2_9STRA|nr:hypothetical protein PHYPSEUDO_006905 [Phytophthora pseudosyringae]